MKKVLSFLLAMTMTTAMMAGCSKDAGVKKDADGQSSPPVETAKAPVKIKFVVPGTPYKDNDMVLEEVNKKMLADGVGVQVEKVFIPSDAWDQKLNLMLSTGEEFDLFHIMQDKVGFSSYLSRGALADVTQAVEKYGANLKKSIPADIWDAAKNNGKIYTIPTYWVEMASEGEFDIRMDLLKQNNLEVPKTPDELLKVYDVVMKNWKGKNKPYMPGVATFDPISYHTTVLHRSYDTFPFTVKDKIMYVSQNGDVKSWIETPEFKKDAEFMRKAYTMGLLNPDILVLKQDQIKNLTDNGDWFVNFGTIGTLSSIQKNNPNATVNDVQAIYFNTEKPYLRPLAMKNCNSVPSTSKNVDSAIKFLNWIYTSQDNYDLYLYGIEGKHYKKVGARGIEKLLDPNNNNASSYSGSESQAGNLSFIRTDDVKGLPANNKVLYSPNEKAQNSIAGNFMFDATNVKAEYSNVMTEAASSITPIYMGVLEYDKAFPAALEKMKKAGLDKVVAEYQKQFKEWRAKGGK